MTEPDRCYYGADGKLQKVLVAAPAPQKKKRGLRGKIIEGKKEELADYMERAVTLVRYCVPPDPTEIQRAKDAGKVSVSVIDPGKRIRLEFHDYRVPGDALNGEVDLTNNLLAGMRVSSFLGEQNDPVSFDVHFGTLPDGSTYPAEALLEAKAKNLKVAVTNFGYLKMGS